MYENMKFKVVQEFEESKENELQVKLHLYDDGKLVLECKNPEDDLKQTPFPWSIIGWYIEKGIMFYDFLGSNTKFFSVDAKSTQVPLWKGSK